MLLQALYLLAVKAPEVKMIVVMALIATAVAQRKVVLTIIGQYFVRNAVFAKVVQHTVYGNAIYSAFYLGLNPVLAQGRVGLLKQL